MGAALHSGSRHQAPTSRRPVFAAPSDPTSRQRSVSDPYPGSAHWARSPTGACTVSCARKTLAACGITPVIHHEAAVLDDLDASTGQRFGDIVIPYSQLKPDDSRPFSKHVIEMAGDVLWAAEHLNHIYLAGYVRESA